MYSRECEDPLSELFTAVLSTSLERTQWEEYITFSFPPEINIFPAESITELLILIQILSNLPTAEDMLLFKS